MNMFWRRKAKKKPLPETRSAPLSPGEDPSSLGNVLVDLGVLTPEQLHRVIVRQRSIGEGVLGALACEAGFCTLRDVAKAMEIQASMRDGKQAEAAIGFQGAATEEMSATAKQLSDTIQGARLKARARGEKTGLFLLKSAE